MKASLVDDEVIEMFNIQHLESTSITFTFLTRAPVLSVHLKVTLSLDFSTVVIKMIDILIMT